METGRGRSPSSDEARDALRQLTADSDAVRYPPLPRWFFAAQAGVAAAVFMAQLLPPSDARNATFAAVVVALVLGGRYWIYRDRVSGVTPSPGDMGSFLAAVVGTVLVCLIVDETTDAWWFWIVGAAVAAGIVLGTGHTYRRTYGDAG